MPSATKAIHPTDLRARLDAGEQLVLIDVREADEVKICAIPGARHIPMNDVPRRVEALDRDAAIVVHCHHGMRSQMVGAFLLQQGFTDVANLTGGIARWADEVEPGMNRY